MTTVNSNWQISGGGVNGWYNSTNITMEVLNNDWVRFTYKINMKHSGNFSWTNGSGNYTNVQLATSNGTNIRTDKHNIGRVGYKNTSYGPNETSWGPYIMDFRRESANKTVAARSMIHVNGYCPGNQWTDWAWFTIPAKPKPKPTYVAPKKPSISNTNLNIKQGSTVVVNYSRDTGGTAGSENHITLFSKTGINVGTADPKDKSKIEWKKIASSNASGSFTAFNPISWVANKNYNPYKKYSLKLMVADYRLINNVWKQTNSDIKTFTLLPKEKPKIVFPTISNIKIQQNIISWSVSTTNIPKEKCYFDIQVFQDEDNTTEKKIIYSNNKTVLDKAKQNYSLTINNSLLQKNHAYSFNIKIIAKDDKYNEILGSSQIFKSNKYYTMPIPPIVSGQLYNNQLTVKLYADNVQYASGYKIFYSENNEPPKTMLLSKTENTVTIANINTNAATVSAQTIGLKNNPTTDNLSAMSSDYIVNKQSSKYRLFFHKESSTFGFVSAQTLSAQGETILLRDTASTKLMSLKVCGKTQQLPSSKDFVSIDTLFINFSNTPEQSIQIPVNLKGNKLAALSNGVCDEIKITREKDRGRVQLIKKVQESDPTTLYGTTYLSWNKSEEMGHLNPIYIDTQGSKPGTLENELVFVNEVLSQKTTPQLIELGYINLPPLPTPNAQIEVTSNLGPLNAIIEYEVGTNKIMVTSG